MRTAVIELLKERVDDDLMTKSSDDELLKKSYKLMTSCRGTVVIMSCYCEGDLLDMGGGDNGFAVMMCNERRLATTKY